jgi:hypothetical protein
MSIDNGWDAVRSRRSRLEMASMGALRVALLFGSAAVALALILAPVLDNQVNDYLARNDSGRGLDMMSTGTIGGKASYTIRKSVLQSTPNSVCILRSNGTRSGDC